MKWYYYLHSNGDLIGKNPIVVDNDPSYFDSSFVKKVWEIETEERKDAWVIVLEALALGANIKRVRELKDKWVLTKEDLIEFLLRVPPTDLTKKGFHIFVETFLEMQVDEFLDNFEKIMKNRR